MSNFTRWTLGVSLALFITVAPAVYFRYHYTDHKRLRVVEPGVLYRSGQLSADGFTEAVLRYQIRTIINAMDEVPDPDLASNWWRLGTIKESELCRQLGVRYVHLKPDTVSRRTIPGGRPEAIDQFLEILDDPTNHPVLLHCRAGLHRTGVLTAVYRMEHGGCTAAGCRRPFTQLEALDEMKELGFGDFFCTSANDYVKQYVLTYRPRARKSDTRLTRSEGGAQID